VEDKLVKQPEVIKIKKIKSPLIAKAKPALAPAKKTPLSNSNLKKDTKVVAKTPVVTAKKVTKAPRTRAPKTITKATPVESKAVSVKNVESPKRLPRTKKVSTASPKVIKNKDLNSK
jgi:hypothetical protein